MLAVALVAAAVTGIAVWLSLSPHPVGEIPDHVASGPEVVAKTDSTRVKEPPKPDKNKTGKSTATESKSKPNLRDMVGEEVRKQPDSAM